MNKFKFESTLAYWEELLDGQRIGDTIQFNNEKGKGKLEGFRLSDEIEMFRLDMELTQELHINNKQDNVDFIPLFFGESVDQTLTMDEKEEKVKEFNNNSIGAFCTNVNKSLQWKFPVKKNLKFVTLKVKKELFYNLVEKSEKLKNVLSKEQIFFEFEEFDPKMREFFNKIHSIEGTGIFDLDFMENYANNLLLLFFKNILAREDISETKKYPFNVDPVFKAQTILENTLDRPVSIDNLAEDCGISESRLRFLFKHVFGTTIHQYHQDLRLNKSRFLLRKGSKTMSMIAMDLGFSSSSHFSMVFKKQYKVTPKQFKNNHFAMA
ncbi:helix-turn-helix domain-containing protein [Flammeovirga kamogawensis]|uniref:AraC family transcriptional regulator n=1 Tax=Flammeovirga kamogawensis TaxID=373891 RepID=A0ABX8H1Q7_9BACT|nr:helix-turn-helix domain-containing protein [Flammeovirga kamogawensis]MBB6462399.1 AraC-like DNA-binding protein [Flammeovirga kamogawensis]QWG09512.1 AraC family transcriptional regulator [Flammeovirga kamogawensis]TRX65028.1 helix-turn-helix domain-containing protein [Flammeovirga kamogawensis]